MTDCHDPAGRGGAAPRGLSDEEMETACANLRNDVATIQSVRGETVRVRVDVVERLLTLRAKVEELKGELHDADTGLNQQYEEAREAEEQNRALQQHLLAAVAICGSDPADAQGFHTAVVHRDAVANWQRAALGKKP